MNASKNIYGSNKTNCANTQKCTSDNSDAKSSQNSCKLNLTPAQALVIGGILTGVLDIFSFLIDVNQRIQITLIGSVQTDDPQKPDLTNILDTLGSMPLDDVLSAVINRLNK